MISITPYNFMMTADKASQKLCPFVLDSNMETCAPNTCMAWIEAHQKISREDHSGAREIIQDESRKRNGQEIKREGPPGCSGYLILEAQGFCLKLWKEVL